MQVAQAKKDMAEAVRSKGSGPDPFSPEAKARRQRLMARINASHSEAAEKADAALSEYLNTLYAGDSGSQ